MSLHVRIQKTIAPIRLSNQSDMSNLSDVIKVPIKFLAIICDWKICKSKNLY